MTARTSALIVVSIAVPLIALAFMLGVRNRQPTPQASIGKTEAAVTVEPWLILPASVKEKEVSAAPHALMTAKTAYFQNESRKKECDIPRWLSSSYADAPFRKAQLAVFVRTGGADGDGCDVVILNPNEFPVAVASQSGDQAWEELRLEYVIAENYFRKCHGDSPSCKNIIKLATEGFNKDLRSINENSLKPQKSR